MEEGGLSPASSASSSVAAPVGVGGRKRRIGGGGGGGSGGGGGASGFGREGGCLRSGPTSASASSSSSAATPRRIVTWNANGLAPRCKWGVHELNRLVQMTGHPDLILVQEARLRAADDGAGVRGGEKDRGRPSPSEWREVQHCFSRRGGGGSGGLSCGGGDGGDGGGQSRPSRPPFERYEPVWSLSDRRYAGTLALVRRDLFRSSPSDGGDSSAAGGEIGSNDNFEEWRGANTASSFGGAVELLLEAYGGVSRDEVGYDFSEDDGNENEENSKPTTSSRSGGAKSSGGDGLKQSSMTAFLSLCSSSAAGGGGGKKRKRPAPAATDGRSRRRRRHHPDGRVQYLRFPNLDVLHTYVPNNGLTSTSFARRRKFDLDVGRFLEARSRILSLAGNSEADRPLLWAGDMNVARDYRDGTHWRSVDPAGGGGTATIEEWWTDESRCLTRSARKASAKDFDGEGGTEEKDPEDQGMPSFTPAERSRFGETLRSAGLVDVWRELHPDGVTDRRCPVIGGGGLDEPNRWERAEWTWRGTSASASGRGGGGGGYRALYQGRAQRLDYFLLSEGMFKRGVVESCDILGYGEGRRGLFCGSDHCASLLVVKDRK